jgi:ElaA protein
LTPLAWTWARLDDLTARDVYDLLALRSEVFVMEQQCVFLDADGADMQAWHLLGRNAQGGLDAYLRLVDPGVKYAEPSIGRVVTHPNARGTGLGRLLMQEGIARTHDTWPGQATRIGAQARLQRFYEDLGFVRQGDEYIEDGIPHIEMELQGEQVQQKRSA